MRWLVVVLLACAADHPNQTAVITYEFNHTPYVGSLIASATLTGNQLGIEASDSDGDMLEIAVQPEAMLIPGTYVVAPAPPLATLQFTEGGLGTWDANQDVGNGTVVISTLTGTQVTGTFEASMTGSGTNPGSGVGMLTKGTFDVPID